MSSSGLIYAVIVGAWAAYLVPMWLRRQDELNEARPTERFSTAIRLLSGRAAMERRYAKDLRERTGEQAQAPSVVPAGHDAPAAERDGLDDPEGPGARQESISSVDVRGYSAPPALTEARIEVRQDEAPPSRHAHAPARDDRSARDDGSTPRRRPAPAAPSASAARRRPAEPDRATRARRSKVLARRRRTTVLLFLAFTAGAVAAAVGGLRLLWAPAVPAVLLSVYIAHLRVKERRRFAFTMDRRRAEEAALRLRETRGGRRPATAGGDGADGLPAPQPAPRVSPHEAGRRALVEQTDHAEWLDQQRERRPGRGDSWEPVPVPLPTYVTAPVAPRATSGVDVSDPETWSAARSSTADPTPPPAQQAPQPAPPRRAARDRGRTPLFDQYDEADRPRAANE
ncbi:gephyrin-like molybdotransferase receptor GlpR [Streptomyces sp. NRRL F-5126]|uniref:divisome protein SepX/GlpR n=1 Tax=Streptomyces sp. NRRL F-5126 TaxID=1463857 RepID=UPI0004C96901|nr:gephyrin-like molybdotransferase receptor GlpR [Streptomyces sp. NRRL F-5126]